MTQLEEEKRAFAQRYHCVGLAITNRSDIAVAARRAYQDTMPRTIASHGVIAAAEIDKLCSDLAEKISVYFEDDAPVSSGQFDKRHKALCRDFLNDYNKLLADHKLPEQAYGKAQKIVNMTFKYLYCFDDACEHDAWFEYCHMPIDSTVAAWWKEKGITTCAISWTKLIKKEYLLFTNLARRWCQAHPLSIDQGVSTRPLDFELVIWNKANKI
ncbi:MAG: hypothetical protein UCH28_11770 [Adlercreutzia sp.]|nr:hypothetical protein [Adlercreutzia sp.]